VKYAALAAALLLSGCAAGPETVALPNGQTAQLVRCDGYARSITDCMNGAGAICRGPYRVLDQEDSNDGDATFPFSNGSTVTVPIVHRSMLVECGNP
jgi:uncharacterized membrane protein